MLLLVTDTSGKNGSVALARVDEGAESPEVIACAPLAGGTFSAQLVPQIRELLSAHGFRKTQIDAFIVVSGPGSFTGLRVGLAAIKALAEILNKPIVPVSLLEVAAVSSHEQGTITAALDAGRGEIYVGEYEVRDNSWRTIRERLLTKDELSFAIRDILIVTPNEAVATTARNSSKATLKVVIDSASIARVGWQKMRAGQTVSPEQLDANYIRRSDAEIFARPAHR
jgi:tRNA threonylcarbamoyladenosine biosynthesis protein TsaB